MISRFSQFRGISKTSPHFFHPGLLNQLFKMCFTLHNKLDLQFHNVVLSTVGREWGVSFIHSLSTKSEAPQVFSPKVDLLTFFKSAVDHFEGPNHCWLNKLEESKMSFRRDGPFLVVAGIFTEDRSEVGLDRVLMFERVKYLQRRYPQLHVFGFQSDNSVSSRTQILQTIMKEYLTFPVLLSNKDCCEMNVGVHYLLFKDFKGPMLYYEKEAEIKTISKAIDENFKTIQELNGNEIKQLDVINGPCVSSFQNLFLYYPGCISVDEDGNRLFLSDSNHHRVIIFNSDGKILDCIGSSPGFEDGEFESAKLLRPAASLYDAVEDSLYFVDSENHAVRRADIGKRTLETIYPPCNAADKFSRMWSWVLDIFGIRREVAPKSEELDLEPLVTPWHLMESRENNLLIANRSFHTLWILNPSSGMIEKVVTGYQNVLEICGQMITERVSLLKQIFGDKVNPEAYSGSTEGVTDVSLMSSLTTFHNDIIFCDTVGQAVLKFNRESGIISNLHISNFGILGLPYWLALPLEKFYTGKISCDHTQCFSVLPGRCDIVVHIDIPLDTELAGPLQEGSIWRQARGSAAEISGYDDTDASTEKVGVAQQWFDELDNLAFSSAGPEASADEESGCATDVQGDNRVHIQSSINISPGTSEVIIYAVLYLKMKRNWISHEKPWEEIARRMLNIVDEKSQKQGADTSVQLMLESIRDIREVVFMKPLHLRFEFDCKDHPKADKANEVVLTDSTLEVNVSLD